MVDLIWNLMVGMMVHLAEDFDGALIVDLMVALVVAFMVNVM